MREIVLDTETTGLDPNHGHRLVEIGCVELENRIPTGRVYHQYIHPERDMPPEAEAVHGLSLRFLQDFPRFADVSAAFIDFVADSTLVIHNADFDMKFLNWELANQGLAILPRERAIDTVKMSRKKFPGQRASLDALCSRFGIDNSRREKHGALLDAELLAEVYIELTGGKQPGLSFAAAGSAAQQQVVPLQHDVPQRQFAVSEAEQTAHRAFLQGLDGPLWHRLTGSEG